MAKPFKSLKEKMSPTPFARAEKRAKKTLAEMRLNELRAEQAGTVTN